MPGSTAPPVTATCCGTSSPGPAPAAWPARSPSRARPGPTWPGSSAKTAAGSEVNADHLPVDPATADPASPAAPPREVGRAAGRTQGHARSVPRERQADTTGLRAPRPWPELLDATDAACPLGNEISACLQTIDLSGNVALSTPQVEILHAYGLVDFQYDGDLKAEIEDILRGPVDEDSIPHDDLEVGVVELREAFDATLRLSQAHENARGPRRSRGRASPRPCRGRRTRATTPPRHDLGSVCPGGLRARTRSGLVRL